MWIGKIVETKTYPHVMIKFEDLYVTQNGIRHPEKVLAMRKFIKNGGFFNKNALIKIKRMPDGRQYIHDGHHRALAIYLSGRDHLHADEYILTHWDSYDSYKEINMDVHWITPFDIKTEIRFADLMPFKRHVLSLSEDDAIEYIKNHKHLYCEPRNGVDTVVDLANQLFKEKE